ncbi:helix-turn-helix transcriptional regulator [Kitasatospora sp. NPDC086791]|uniref:helix-turn-helix domain-containing protein n=1 Tax=Kitasatospora sp. NPDC086791 TaxID=3155178 RepID=UPI00343A1305
MARYPSPDAVIPAGWLITQARLRTGDLSQSALAGDSGVGQTALSRYETGRSAPSFEDLQRIVANTDYRLEVTLRREPRDLGPVERLLRNDPLRFEVSDLNLRCRLPAQLAPVAGRFGPSEPDGPRLSEALLHLYEIQDLARDALRPEERLQLTYERYGSERDRDLIHQMLSVGVAASQAAAVLARIIHHGTDRAARRRGRKDTAEEPRVARILWAHVVCCLRAQEAICRDRVARMDQALEAARRRQRAADRLQEAEMLASSGGLSIEEARADVEKASRRCAALARNGGSTAVGLAGERYLAVELGELADRARALFDRLAEHPSFVAWRSEHATVDPLYDAWLDGQLAAALAPPRLYVDHASLVHDRRLLAGAQAAAAKPGQGGAQLSERDGRRVRDQHGREWQIAITSPTAATAPKRKQTADIVATLDLRAESSNCPVYLLAENVDAAEAADVIAAAPNPASLADITARILTHC